MLEVTWIHNNKEILDTSLFLKKYKKDTKVKAYNFTVLALALVNRDALSVGSLELNEQGFKLMGLGGKTGFIVFMSLMFLILTIEPISVVLKKYKGQNGILARLGYKKKKTKDTLAKDIVLYLLCLALLAVPFLLF